MKDGAVPPLWWKNGGEKVEVIKKVEGEEVVIKEVPAWVCKQCGERYYLIDAIEHINDVLREVSEERVKLQKILASELNLRLLLFKVRKVSLLHHRRQEI